MNKSRHPLPVQKDGVLPNGTVINAPDSLSCWTKPIDPPILGMYSNFSSGLCQICVIQNSTDSGPYKSSSFEFWVRDSQNHAIGGAGPVDIIRSDSSSPNYFNFLTAGKQINVLTTSVGWKNASTLVHMAWNDPQPLAPKAELMEFDSRGDRVTRIPIGGKNCRSSGSAQDWAILYFQCQFLCPSPS